MFLKRNLLWTAALGLLLLVACSPQAQEEPLPAAPTAVVEEPVPEPSPTALPEPSLTAEPAPSPEVISTAVPEDGKPDLRYLEAAVADTLADFSGVSSYVIIDLQTGERFTRNEDVAIAGMSLIKVPILVNVYSVLDGPPDVEQTKLITETTALSSNYAANLLLQTVAGVPNSYTGADIVTQSMRDLGLFNTFIAVPIDADPRPGRLNTVLTPANSRTDITTHADPYRQTTTGDLANLLEMIYFCAKGEKGPLSELYDDKLTAGECQEMLDMMQLNELARLLENGLPEGTTFAHKVGWIDDTHGDGGIVFSPGGDYIIVMALYSPDWLEWEDSAPLFEQVSRQAYAHFNDPDAYAGVVLPPQPTSLPATPTPDLPHAIVSGTQGIGLTVRETPGGAEVAILPEGSVLTLLEEPSVEQGGFKWQRVRTPDGDVGWAADAYFTIWEG